MCLLILCSAAILRRCHQTCCLSLYIKLLNHVGVSCRHRDTSPRDTWAAANIQEGFPDIVAPRKCSRHGPLGPTLSFGADPGHPESCTELLSPSLASCPVNRHPTFPLFNIALQGATVVPSQTDLDWVSPILPRGPVWVKPDKSIARRKSGLRGVERQPPLLAGPGPRLPLWVPDGYHLPPTPRPDGRAPLGAHLSLLWT